MPDAGLSGEAVVAHRIPYRLPLRRPWRWAGGELNERCGILLRLETPDRYVGWGDIAPFPAVAIGPDQALAHADQCARLDIAAQRAGVPLAAWLGGGAAPPAVVVNAALGDLAGISPEAVQTACELGFDILKIKVGRGAPAEEITRLGELAARLPAGVGLRLDANRSWDEAAARRFLDACRDLPVESLEEPLRRPTLAALGTLQESVPFPLALDESLADFFAADCLAGAAVRRLVIKPARQGGLLASLELARRARDAGVECVVTSALESTCGLLAAAHLAAVIAPAAAHGLATADWFAADTGTPPPVTAGRLFLSDRPGLGFHPRLS